MSRIFSISGWSLLAFLLSFVIVPGVFIGAMFAIAISDAQGQQWLKVAFWVLARSRWRWESALRSVFEVICGT